MKVHRSKTLPTDRARNVGRDRDQHDGDADDTLEPGQGGLRRDQGTIDIPASIEPAERIESCNWTSLRYYGRQAEQADAGGTSLSSSSAAFPPPGQRLRPREDVRLHPYPVAAEEKREAWVRKPARIEWQTARPAYGRRARAESSSSRECRRGSGRVRHRCKRWYRPEPKRIAAVAVAEREPRRVRPISPGRRASAAMRPTGMSNN